ncbi:hypothetical protein [uncultured Thiohalocapsa sp.]|uniref:hypothetical protein n=1 Tax=uncultured Thiohalocapsa sp. TaxID=768990 RepID=UPI0025DC0F97|nr:hypothetical protein [uncultured Thiohalocapsa sp.]
MYIVDLRASKTAAGGTRVEANVDGEPLWFESDDALLTPSAEAYASALLIPASARGAALELDTPIDTTWLDNVAAIMRVAKEWWGLAEIEVIAETAPTIVATQPTGTAQCFTGGVDSYYALVTATPPPDVLVFGHGFDIELRDHRRLEAFVPSLKETASAYGSRPVVIKTNLRRHRALRQISWEKAHGGALAALGHLLNHEIGRLVIPSSYPYHDGKPWGTHWELDHLWSSRSLAVEHSDASLRRNGKLRVVAQHEVALRHLRVCWENNAPTGNCSRCEKCVRTMLALSMCDRLQACRTFDRTLAIEARLDALPSVSPHLLSIYEELRRGIADQCVGAAVDRLIARSQGFPGCLRELAQRVRHALRTL